MSMNIEHLIEKHSGLMYIIAFGVLKNKEDTLDALQDAWLCIFRNRHNLSEAKNVRAYLCTASYNAAIDLWRKRKRKISLEKYFERRKDYYTDNFLEKEELKEGIGKLLLLLSEKERELVKVYYLEDNTQKRTAELLQTNLGNVKSGINRAIYRLKKLTQ